MPSDSITNLPTDLPAAVWDLVNQIAPACFAVAGALLMLTIGARLIREMV